uniref:KH_10 domain-containing protein n=1 Tax=Haemonchus contortus TaxID=6289 RepID=A0A7I4Y124_HAECO
MAPLNESSIVNRFPSIDLSIRPSLHQILEQPEQFFHISQQSTKMSIDHSRRTRLSNELKRRADIERYRESVMKPASLRQELVDVEQVTLTMEVTYSDYEEMFTKRTLGNTEESCANIMLETNTVIQFPDRDEPNPDFIHQVTITGHLTGVEEARIRLRKFCPLVLMFAVSERLREGIPYKKLNCWIKERIEDGSINFPSLVIQALPQPVATSFKEPVIRISGRVADEELLSKACERLRELLFVPEVAEKISFSTHMEVPAAQRSQIVGTPDGAQLLVISRFTKALLHFPSHSEESAQTLFFYFTGQPDSILKARRYVQGLLPMQLCFHAGSEDLRAHIQAENRLIKFYDEMLRVSVRVIPSDLESLSVLPGDQMRHFISLRTSEYNVGALYAVMRRVLKRGEEIPMITPTDYAEMLPLVPDLIKYACEVNVKANLPLNVAESSEGNNSSRKKPSPVPYNRQNCLDTSVDTNSSAQSYKSENGTSSHAGGSNRSRNSSPQNIYSGKSGLRFSDKENSTRGAFNNYGRAKNYNNERRNNSFRSFRFGATNPPHSKHHLALRNREGDVEKAGESRLQRNPNMQTEGYSRAGGDDVYLRRRNNHLQNGADRLNHGVYERRNGAEWRANQSKPAESFNQRPRNEKIELQRRDREEQAVEDQDSNIYRQSNKRMDVMDLIKLASGEDNDRKLTLVGDDASVLDSGDATGSNSVIVCNKSDTIEAFQGETDVAASISSDSNALLSCSSSNLHIQRYHDHSVMLPAAR